MRLEILIISILVFLFCNRLIAQDKYIGFNTWNNTNGLLSKNIEYAFSKYFGAGISAEFVPKKAMFSLSAGLQYLNIEKIFMIPISLNFIPGNKFKLRINGGLLPTIRIKTIDPQKIFGIGWNAGIGFDVRLNSQYTLCCNTGVYTVPTHYYHTDHFGSTSEDMNMYNIEYLSLGLNYLIDRNNK